MDRQLELYLNMVQILLIGLLCFVTVVSSQGCNVCNPGSVRFMQQEPSIPGSTSSYFRPEGCGRIRAICEAGENNVTSMEFNGWLGGPPPSNGPSRVVTALLQCNSVNGKWSFTMFGVTNVITQIACLQVPYSPNL